MYPKSFVVLVICLLVACGDDPSKSARDGDAQNTLEEGTGQSQRRNAFSTEANTRISAADPGSNDNAPLFCIVSLTTVKRYYYPAKALANHADYARRHGYRQVGFTHRISASRFLDLDSGDIDDAVGGGLFWQKIVAVKVMLDEITLGSAKRSCDWVMWIDADAIITNFSVSLGDVVSKSLATVTHTKTEDVHVILSRDQDGPVNAGVFFIRNSQQGRGFIDTIIASYPLFRDEKLPEQAAMSSLSSSPMYDIDGRYLPIIHPKVAIVPQRIFNSFGAGGELDPKRKEESRWQPGDFIEHFAGLSNSAREIFIELALQNIQY